MAATSCICLKVASAGLKLNTSRLLLLPGINKNRLVGSKVIAPVFPANTVALPSLVMSPVDWLMVKVRASN